MDALTVRLSLSSGTYRDLRTFVEATSHTSDDTPLEVLYSESLCDDILVGTPNPPAPAREAAYSTSEYARLGHAMEAELRGFSDLDNPHKPL